MISQPNPVIAEPATPSLALAMDRLGKSVRSRRNEAIYEQESSVEHLYRVVSGVVRTTRVTVEGHRQVGDFYYAGDIFGLEPGPLHRFGADALTDSKIMTIRRSEALHLVGVEVFNVAILQALTQELERAQEHVVVLGRKGAVQRVASFLLRVAAESGDENVALPMGRQDIADYLGLTIETVSRTLTQLQGDSLVEFPSFRRFSVRRREALEALVA